MNELQRPGFSEFDVVSTGRRRRFSIAFLMLCVMTASLSIVVLGVLLTSIIVGAMPVFGPHADMQQTNSRIAVSQGPDAGNNPGVIDTGDLIQGIFQVQQVVRGGRGSADDDVLVDPETGEVRQVQLGFYSLVVQQKVAENTFSLAPARGEQSVAALLTRLGVSHEGLRESAGLVVLKGSAKNLPFEDIEIEGPLVSDRLVEQLSTVDGWTLLQAAGPASPDDFAQVLFTDRNDGDIARLVKTRSRKKAGSLRILYSFLFNTEHPAGQYKPLKLRPFAGGQPVAGHLMIDDAGLTGVSRRKKKGFDLAGKLDLEYCPVPEPAGSTANHVSHFLSESTKTDPTEAGVGPALWGSIWVIIGCAIFALPLGIATAVFLEEFKSANKVLGWLQGLIQLNITNLAGVPSIVYGILGLTAFAYMFGVFGSVKDPWLRFGATYYHQYLTEAITPVLVPIDGPTDVPTLTDGMDGYSDNFEPIALKVIGSEEELPTNPEILKRTLRSDAVGGTISEKAWYYFQLPFGRSVLAASLTLMLVILPVVIISSQEALRAVPPSLRAGALGLGSTQWQVVRNVTLPAAIPGIMTGAILSISRAIGEAAPIVVLCGIVYISRAPQHVMDQFSVLPVQIFYLTTQPPDAQSVISFQNVAAAGSLVLLVVLLTFNAVAIVLRQITQKPLS